MKRLTAALLLLLFVFVYSGCLRGRNSPEEFYFGNYSEAEALYNQKQYDKALQRYQAYIDENPEGNLAIISQYYMAKCYAALGKPEEARVLYKKLVAEHPDLVWANFSEAQLKELENAPAAAPASAAPVISEAPKYKKKKRFLFF